MCVSKHLCSDIAWWTWGIQRQLRAAGASVNTALKTLMSFSICGKLHVFLLQQNIGCLLPMECLELESGPAILYSSYSLTPCFLSWILQYQKHTSSHLNLDGWKPYLSLKRDSLAFLAAVIICRFLMHVHVDETKQRCHVFSSTNTVLPSILVTKNL